MTRILFYRLANGLLLYGETARTIGLGMGYPSERMDVIGNSHDIAAVERDSADPLMSDTNPNPDDVKWGPADCAEVVGAVVRPTPSKRLELLVEAVQILRARGRNIGVLIVGEGPCREPLQELAAALGVPASLPGPIYSAVELAQVYARLVVSVVPEAVGLTAIQSLWYGRPVITCDDAYRQMPEYECIKPGVTGDLYARDNTLELANAIERWLDRSRTDGQRTSRV